MILNVSIERIAISVIVFIVGLIIGILGEKLISSRYRKNTRTISKEIFGAKLFKYIVVLITVGIALGYLSIEVEAFEILLRMYLWLPTILAILLLFIFGVTFVNVMFFVVTKFFEASGLAYLIKEYEWSYTASLIGRIVKFILYVVVVLFVLRLSGISVGGFVSSLLSYFVFPLFVFVLILLIFVFKDTMENIGAGFTVRSAKALKEGESLEFRSKKNIIKAIGIQGVTVKQTKDTSAFIPYKVLASEMFKFKRIDIEFNKIENVKKYFIAQSPSYCGPASAAMVLNIFGFRATQEQIGKLAKTIVPEPGQFGGTKPKDLVTVVNKVTKGKVKGAWISSDKVTNLKQEIKEWLNEKGIVIVDYKKSFLFPGSLKAHYSVCLGVRGDDLLLLDPNDSTGGAYLVNYRRVKAGMDTYSEFIGGKRGYLVFALEGTKANYRIKKGLIYSDRELYHKLSNALQKKLWQMKQKAASMGDILPNQVRSFLERYSQKERVTRVWRPKKK